jgi:putative transposase
MPLIKPEWEQELFGYIRGKAIALGCIPHAINGMADHIHVVISIPPALSVAKVIGQLKGASSHYINTVYVEDKGFAWQAGYGIFSVSERGLNRVIEYVRNQKKHHLAHQDWGAYEPEQYDASC